MFTVLGTSQHVVPTVHVLVTTVEGTRAAVAAAAPIARERRAPVVLLFEREDWETTRSLRAAREVDPSVSTRCLAGAGIIDSVKALVPVRATIVIGGATCWWWPTRAQRLAARLLRHGRDAIFVGSPHTPPRRQKISPPPQAGAGAAPRQCGRRGSSTSL